MSRFLIFHLHSGAEIFSASYTFHAVASSSTHLILKTPFSFLCLCDSYFDDQWDHDWLIVKALPDHSFLNTLLWSKMAPCQAGSEWDFIIILRNLTNITPCNGLVKYSASISRTVFHPNFLGCNPTLYKIVMHINMASSFPTRKSTMFFPATLRFDCLGKSQDLDFWNLVQSRTVLSIELEVMHHLHQPTQPQLSFLSSVSAL